MTEINRKGCRPGGGLAGIARLASRGRQLLPPGTEAALWCVAVGLALTAAGSA